MARRSFVTKLFAIRIHLSFRVIFEVNRGYVVPFM